MWNQVYDPFNNWIFSTLSAALPVVTLLVLIASNKVKAHIAAIIALIVANLVAIFIFTMPSGLALRATVFGAVTGFFPIGWIVLNVMFLYRLTEKGDVRRAAERDQRHHHRSTAATAAHRVLVRRVLRGRGRIRNAGGRNGRDPDRPRLLAARASALSLIANTAPVAFGALGTPIAGWQRDRPRPWLLGAMVGRQLPIFSLIVPFWLIWVLAGWRGMLRRLARGARLRRVVRGAAIPGLELPQSVDCRHRRVAGARWPA